MVILLLVGCLNNLNCDYVKLLKGSYNDKFYIVKKGDIFYFIVWISDSEVSDFVCINKLKFFY